MDKKDLLIELAAKRILNLYRATPLYFTCKGTDHVLDVDYSGLLVLLLGSKAGYPDGIEPGFITRTSKIGSDSVQSNHYRRSLEDMFLLAKHYIPNASITEVAKATKDFSSAFCFDTGLRVYKEKLYYYNMGSLTTLCDQHHLTTGVRSNGILSSMWWYGDVVLDDKYILDSDNYDDFIEIIKKAEECAKNHPNFVAVGRGYLNSESTQSL